MQNFVLIRPFSTRIIFSTIGLILFFTCLFSGNLMAVNIECSKINNHNFRITQTSSSSSQDNYDVLSYDIDLKIKHTDPDKIRGTVGFEALILEDNVGEIQINLADNMTVVSVYNESGQLGFNHADNLITVTLDRIYNKDEIITVITSYKGWPQPCYMQGFDVKRHDEITRGQLVISTLSEPECARSWWPCKDQVNDKADSYNIAIQVDKEFYCVSNGRLDSTIMIGDTTHTFYYKVGHPMTTYSFALAVSDYAIWEHEWVYNEGQDTMPIFHYVFRQHDGPVNKNQWEKTSDALTLLSDWFGLYPFADEKYGHANYQAPYGMEHQTISFMPGKNTIVFDTLIYLYHELAHQWWGNMITCKTWNDVWIQEALATYAQALYFEHEEGWRDYHRHMNEMRCERTDRSVYFEDGTDFDALFDRDIVYYKGAWVMHMLRRKLGDDLFRACFKALYNSEYKYGSITTEEFIDVFNNTAKADEAFIDVSGDTTKADLHKFFDQWIYGIGLPIYEWSYWQGPADPTDGSINIFLYVKQVQETDPEIFEMPVDFVFDYYDDTLKSDTVTLEVNSKINRYVVEVKDEIDTVKLDPMNWVLQKNENIGWQMRIVTQYVPEIQDIALNIGVVGTKYDDIIYTSNDVGEVLFELISDSESFPPGLELSPEGLISGTCTKEGKYDFIISATDQNDTNLVDIASLSITIISLPEKYHLYQNYPNPFNNGTIISFDLPYSGNTTIEIFNILGQKVTTLINGYYFADHKYKINWQGKNDFGKDVSSGIYFYRLQSGDYTSTRKMMLLK